jgi:hypothetical protein
MDLADQLYATLDSATQRSIEKERDVLGTNGTSSMSASLRGSNSSLNSMPGGVISTCYCCGDVFCMLRLDVKNVPSPFILIVFYFFLVFLN